MYFETSHIHYSDTKDWTFIPHHSFKWFIHDDPLGFANKCLINLVLDWTELYMNIGVSQGWRYIKSWWHMLDKKEIPPVGISNNHGGFCFKGNIVDLFCGIYWFSWVKLQRIVKIRNRHHQGLIKLNVSLHVQY